MGRKIEMSGRYGRWTVLRESDRDRIGQVQWLCRCVCGAESSIRGHDLRNRHSQGCVACDDRDKIQHGMVGSEVYDTWKSMKRRCQVPGDKDFKRYGGRGILMDPAWEDPSVLRQKWVHARQEHRSTGSTMTGITARVTASGLQPLSKHETDETICR